MLERSQLSVFRVILGIPTRAPTLGIHSMLGTLPVKYQVYKKHLVFLHSLLSLPDSATPKVVFMARLEANPSRGFVPNILSILHTLSLPSVSDLLSALPSKLAWKAHVKATLYLEVSSELLTSTKHSLSNAKHLADNIMGRPIRVLTCTRGNVSLARLSNFRIRLLLNCPGLNKDTSVFHAAPGKSRSPICPLCHVADEDDVHFLLTCPALQHIRDRWFATLLPLIDSSNPSALRSHILGVSWSDTPALQSGILHFLSELRSARSAILSP